MIQDTEYHKRVHAINEAVRQSPHYADYKHLRLALAILYGATERRVTLRRKLYQRIVDTVKSAVLEWNRKETVVPISAP